MFCYLLGLVIKIDDWALSAGQVLLALVNWLNTPVFGKFFCSWTFLTPTSLIDDAFPFNWMCFFHFSPPLVCLRFYVLMNDSMQSLCGLHIAEITGVCFSVKFRLKLKIIQQSIYLAANETELKICSHVRNTFDW